MSSPLHRTMGARLACLRTERGWTADALSIASAIPADEIGRYEAGDRIPVERLWRIAKALRVSLSAFFIDGRPVERAVTPTNAGVDEGLALMVAFRNIDDARLRAVLIDIADYFAKGDAL